MLVAVAVMPSACATSVDRAPPRSPDPVIVTRVETVTVCPPELAQALPPAPEFPAGGVLDAAAPVLDWIAARFAREALLARRLTDAKEACPRG